MKLRTIAATTALAGALALTACSNSASPLQLNKPQPTPAAVTQAPPAAPVAAPAPAAPVSTPDPSAIADAVFIANVRSHTTKLGNSDDATLISTVKAACGALDDGNSMQQLVATIVDNAPDTTAQKDLGYMLGAGIQQYCPQYAPQLSQYLP